MRYQPFGYVTTLLDPVKVPASMNEMSDPSDKSTPNSTLSLNDAPVNLNHIL